MGDIYEVHCPDCGYEDLFTLGYGASYYEEAQKLLQEVKDGKHGRLAQNLARQATTAFVDPSLILVKCLKCHRLEQVTDMTLTIPYPDKSDMYQTVQLFYEHKSSCCHARTCDRNHYNYDEYIHRISCPQCGSYDLQVTWTGFWD